MFVNLNSFSSSTLLIYKTFSTLISLSNSLFLTKQEASIILTKLRFKSWVYAVYYIKRQRLSLPVSTYQPPGILTTLLYGLANPQIVCLSISEYIWTFFFWTNTENLALVFGVLTINPLLSFIPNSLNKYEEVISLKEPQLFLLAFTGLDWNRESENGSKLSSVCLKRPPWWFLFPTDVKSA